jgi:uncharacterized protein (DUF4415 family)
MNSIPKGDFESATDAPEQPDFEEEDFEAERDMESWSDADIVVPDGRTRMILYVDTDVYDWFTGQEYDHHSHINEVLRRYIEFRQEN